MSRPRGKHPRGAMACVLRRDPVYFDWPDPPMVPSKALRQIEQARSIPEVRAIVQQYLPKVRKP